MEQTAIILLSMALALQGSFSGTARVVDGDTLRIGTQRVRLHGIDAPELAQRCGTERRHRCGEMAAAWLKARAEGKRLTCTRIDDDAYGRIVAVCRIRGEDLGAAIVEAGWAIAYRRYSLAYVSAEERAQAARRGIWATGFERPEEYRRDLRDGISTPPSPQCRIKGNISASGERIYHLPGFRSYADVRISSAKGERWFCSIEQARRAGWRPVR